jgi:hypothetical protein
MTCSILSILGRREVRRRYRHLFDGARARTWSVADLDDLRGEIVHRRFHVFVEIENDRVMLQIGSKRLLVVWCRDQEVNAGPVIDVLQEADECLALIGFAVAPGRQRERN